MMYFWLVRSLSLVCVIVVFFFKQKTAYEMRISDWSSDVCSSDLMGAAQQAGDIARRHQQGRNDDVGRELPGRPGRRLDEVFATMREGRAGRQQDEQRRKNRHHRPLAKILPGVFMVSCKHNRRSVCAMAGRLNAAQGRSRMCHSRDRK